MELLADSEFRRGFDLKGLNSLRDGHGAIRSFRLGEHNPQWFLCQWNSRHNLASGSFTLEDDRYTISDASKSFTVIDHKKLEFSLDAGKEYTAPRRESEPWPHLLIEQEITQNNRIRDLRTIRCHARFTLLELTSFMTDAKAYHTAQFVWVLTLKDNNPASPSFNSFIWVVFCPFDSRYEYAPFFAQQDQALPNGEFIYSFAAKEYMSGPLWGGKTAEMDFDLYPHVPEILRLAQSRGFMRGSKVDDLVISSTNMGFEITGTYKCRISVEDMRITVEEKK